LNNIEEYSLSMQDAAQVVFEAECHIIYKALLPQDLLLSVRSRLDTGLCMEPTGTSAASIAQGLRYQRCLQLDDLPELEPVLRAALGGYFPDIKFADEVRLYRQICGGIRQHRDLQRASATYTLLIYLSDDFDGGELYLKRPRSEGGHWEFKVTPRAGWGIVFPKSTLHWADAVLGNAKDLLLLDLESQF
jgi:hypothetical protein